MWYIRAKLENGFERGIKMPATKITVEQRQEIIARYNNGEKRSVLADEFGVTFGYIYDLTAPNKKERDAKRAQYLRNSAKDRYSQDFKRKTQDVYIVKIKGQDEKIFYNEEEKNQYINNLNILGIAYTVSKKRKQKEKEYIIAESDLLKLIEFCRSQEAQEILQKIRNNT